MILNAFSPRLRYANSHCEYLLLLTEKIINKIEHSLHTANQITPTLLVFHDLCLKLALSYLILGENFS